MKRYFRKSGKYLVSALLLVVVTASTSLFSSCSMIEGEAGISEGIINYEVSYPYYDGLMKEMLPDEMTLTFKDNVYNTELSSGNMFRTSFIADCPAKTLLHSLKFMNTKSKVVLDQEDVVRMLENLPPFTIVETNDVDSVAGFLCSKAIGVFDDISLPDMVILYTNEISIDDVNWCNQFSEIDGVLLAYETEQFGLRTRYRASSIEELKVEDANFEVSSEFEGVTPEEMHVKLANLFSNL